MSKLLKEASLFEFNMSFKDNELLFEPPDIFKFSTYCLICCVFKIL